MATIKIKRGSGVPSGLTFGELAFDVNNKKLYFGVTSGSFLLTSPDGGVASFNGLTGAVTISGLNGITVSTQSNTIQVSQQIQNITGSATDQLILLGATAGSTGPRVDFGLKYNSSSNTITNTSKSTFTIQGLSGGDSNRGNSIQLDANAKTINLTTDNGVYLYGFSGTPSSAQTLHFGKYDGVGDFYKTILSGSKSPSSVNYTIYLPNANGTIALVDTAQTFTALQTFNVGFTASGATFSGNVSAQSISNASIARTWFM